MFESDFLRLSDSESTLVAGVLDEPTVVLLIYDPERFECEESDADDVRGEPTR